MTTETEKPSLFHKITPERRAELRRMRKEQDMNHETEKLAEAITTLEHDLQYCDGSTYANLPVRHVVTCTQAARRYAEVLPLIEGKDLKGMRDHIGRSYHRGEMPRQIDISELLFIADGIAAIVARGD